MSVIPELGAAVKSSSRVRQFSPGFLTPSDMEDLLF